MVGMLMVKDVPVDFDATRIAGITLGEVLQVTDNRVLSADVSTTNISELAVTAVEATVHVPADAVASQEKAPATAATQATRLGLAADPAAAQLEPVL